MFWGERNHIAHSKWRPLNLFFFFIYWNINSHHHFILIYAALIFPILPYFLFSVSNDSHLHSRSRPCNCSCHLIKCVPSPALKRPRTCCGSSFITPVLPSRMRLFLIAVSFLFSFDGEWEVISSFSFGISTRDCPNKQTISLSAPTTLDKGLQGLLTNWY